MYYEVENIDTMGANQPSYSKGSSAETRIEALKALAALLLREVENLDEIPSSVRFEKNSESIDLYGEVRRFEKDLIRRALTQTRGNQRNAAALLGTKITTLHAKIKRYGFDDLSVLVDLSLATSGGKNEKL